MSHNPPEDPTNPWESTWSQTDSSLQAPVADRCVVGFSGSLDRSTMAKFYGSKMQIGCVVPLVLLSALIWATILSIGFGVYGLTTVAVGVSIAIWFIAVRFIGKNQAKRLCKRRPWLEGPVHGVATSGRLTVWHNDLCLQTNLRSYMFNPNRGWTICSVSKFEIPGSNLSSVTNRCYSTARVSKIKPLGNTLVQTLCRYNSGSRKTNAAGPEQPKLLRGSHHED